MNRSGGAAPLTIEEIRSSVGTLIHVLADRIPGERDPKTNATLQEAYRLLCRAHTSLLLARAYEKNGGSK